MEQQSDEIVDSGDKLTKRLLTPSSSAGVAFSVYLDHAVQRMSVGTKIIFNRVFINEGSVYDTSTGIFKVPRSGVYLLTYTIDCEFPSNPIEVELVVNGASYGSAKAEAIHSRH